MSVPTSSSLAETDTDLSEGWTQATLENCAKLITKGTTPTTYGFKYQSSGIAFIRVENLADGRIDTGSVSVFINQAANQTLRRSQLQPGDILFSIAGTIGRTGLVRADDLPANTNQALAIIRGTGPILLPTFLRMFLESSIAQKQASDGARGGAMNNISLGDVGALEVAIPPLAEQKRIVEKVDQLLSYVNAARERLVRVAVILKRFREVVLAAACSGRLTADWRVQHPSATSDSLVELLRRLKDNNSTLAKKPKEQARTEREKTSENLPNAPTTWKWIPFGEMLLSLRSGSTEVPQIEPTEYPILRSSSVRPGVVDLQDVRFLSAKQSRRLENFLAEDDLLFTRLSGSLEYVANCALVSHLDGCRIQYPDRLFCGRLVEPRCAQYVEIAFANPLLRDFLEVESKSSAGHQRISMGTLTNFLIPLPPLDEQCEIVRSVEALFSLADAIERRVAEAAARVEKLTQAILAKAFRGELVPTEAELARREGRSYETAADLLARIQSARFDQQTSSLQKEKKWPTRSKRKNGDS